MRSYNLCFAFAYKYVLVEKEEKYNPVFTVKSSYCCYAGLTQSGSIR